MARKPPTPQSAVEAPDVVRNAVIDAAATSGEWRRAFLTPPVVGEHVEGITASPTGRLGRFGGTYDGIRMDEGQRYHFFVGGDINGTPQGHHGVPVAQIVVWDAEERDDAPCPVCGAAVPEDRPGWTCSDDCADVWLS